MKRYPALFIKWLSNCFGYKIGMIKIYGNNNHDRGEAFIPHTIIEGDAELLRYLDISGYVLKKEPFNRNKK
jgi:ribosomal protein L3